MWESFREEVVRYTQYVLNRECPGVLALDWIVSRGRGLTNV